APRAAAERSPRPDHGWTAADPLPQPVTQHRDGRGVHEIVARLECTAEEWSGAEDVEQFGRRADPARQPQRLAALLERQVARHVGGHFLKAGKVRTEMKELLLGPRPAEPQHADLRLAGDRQPIEQQRPHDAEGRGRAGGAERQREHDEQRVRWPAGEPPRRVTQVQYPVLHEASSRPKVETDLVSERLSGTWPP